MDQMSDRSEDILQVLRREGICDQTIDTLIGYGFDSNNALNALDVNKDLDHMPDIDDKQKNLLRHVFTQFNFGFNTDLTLLEIYSSDYNFESLGGSSDLGSSLELKSNSSQELRDSEEEEYEELIDDTNSNEELKRIKSLFDKELKLRITKENELISKIKELEESNHSIETSLKALITKDIEEIKGLTDLMKSFNEKFDQKIDKNSIEKNAVQSQEIVEVKNDSTNKISLRPRQKQSTPQLNDLNEINKYIHVFKNGFKCLFGECGKTFDQPYLIKRHIKRHLGIKEFICSHNGCDYRSDKNTDLKRHIHRNHSFRKNVWLKCRYCDNKFKTRFDLNSHKSRAHPFDKCECDQCGKVFSTIQNLRKHMLIHLKKYRCDHNGCHFSGSHTELTIHMKRHKSVRKNISTQHLKHLKCQYKDCPYSSDSPNNLRMHINRHKNKLKISSKSQSFECNLCRSFFESNDSLEKHSKSHLISNSFKCLNNDCDYSTAFDWDLKRHCLRVHKSFANKCLKCGKLLANKSNLTRHLKTHDK